MTYMSQVCESTIHRDFGALVVFMKLIFSCLNLKPAAGFLPYNMPEGFIKTGRGLAAIIVARAEFKPVSGMLVWETINNKSSFCISIRLFIGSFL